MVIKVELFASPGCNRCAQAKRELQLIVEDFGDDRLHWHVVDVLDEIDYAVRLGILSTPAIAIDGQLVFTSLPSAKKLRRTLQERLT
jgi:protein-disulfide isomerase